MTQKASETVEQYDPKKCEHVMSNGHQCGGFKNTGTEYCVAHQVDGLDVDELPTVNSIEELKDFTVQTMYELRKGRITEREAAIMKDYIALVFRQLAQIENPENTDQASKIAQALAEPDDD